jgi:hypothetical protein
MSLRLSLCAGCLVLMSGGVWSPAWGQNRGSTGQNGQGGSGSSMFGSSAGGSSSLGSSGLGGSGSGGNGGFGQSSGLGQGGFGQQGGAGSGQNRNTGLTGQNQNNGFLGVNNNPGNFIGRNNQGQNGNQNGQTGNLGRGNQGGNRRQLDSGLMNAINGNNQQGGGQSQQPVIRPRQKVAFEYPQPKLEVIVATTQTRLQKLAVRYPHLSDVKLVQESDGTVVLSGSSPSEADAKVAENMLRFEPGVRKIRNELTFPPPKPEVE